MQFKTMEHDRSSDDATPLLPPRHYKTRRDCVKSSVRSGIKIVCWVIFIVWAAIITFFPLQIGQDLVQDWISLTQNATIFGSTGSFMGAFSGPIFLIAILAAIYVSLSDDHQLQKSYDNARKKMSGGYSIWTFPVVVEGPFGVVSAAEFIAILAFLGGIGLGFIVYTIESLSDVSSYQTSFLLKCSIALEAWGSNLGMIGLFCLAFLFIPIARGSVILRLIGIPFEHATRYHVWLGHLTMFVFTLHGMSYVLAWGIDGNLIHIIFSWGEMDSIAILPGVIALSCGLLMWVTSLHIFRRKYFEIFFYTHYLYIGFVIFFALHVGDFIFSVALGGILIFMLDRFLRFWQSKKTVDIISATSYPCGVLELVISKPKSLEYNALSFIFVNVHELSSLQWHPFSVSSSPLEGENHITVLVKVLGNWTEELNDKVSRICHEDEDCEQGISARLFQSRIPLTASIEGPYGHQTPYYLKYTNLVLVAGGIGISPFIAILRDVLHRIKQGSSLFPTNIMVIWAIKKSNELSLLPDFESISPSFSDLLDLDIQIFITQQSTPTSPEEKTEENPKCCWISQGSKNRCSMSALVGTGDKNWSSVYVSLSILGFLVILGVVDKYIVDPYDLSNDWYIGLVLLACAVAGVVFVGGLVAVLWHLSDKKTPVVEEGDSNRDGSVRIEEQHNLVRNKMVNVRYGCRPNFEEILESVEEKWGSVDVGVIVCGPQNMETSVAKQIRSRILWRKNLHPIFHFHSHSFEL